MPNPPDDCAIEVRYDAKKHRAPIRLTRLRSTGPHRREICFDRCDGGIHIYPLLPLLKEVRFSISFRLSDGDASGGFAGIKIWPQGSREPDTWLLPVGGRTVRVLDDFDLHVYRTDHADPEKVTLLSIGDRFRLRETFHYCLGVFRDPNRNPDHIAADDPRIYNNGDPGESGGRRPRLRATRGS